MAYLNPQTNEYPVSERELRGRNPNVSFAAVFAPPAPWVWVFPTPQPAFDSVLQAVREVSPALTPLNVYEQRWEVVNLSNEVVAANVAAAKAARLAAFDAALEAHYEATAKQRRYTNKVTCAMRAGYPGPFQAEGLAFGQWMDGCNTYAYNVLAQVEAGTRPEPTNPQALIDELPSMVWPA